MRPLEGMLVVTLEHAVAAPFATRQLADLGARVIKVERPGVGDFARGYDTQVSGESSYFVWLNRGKESLELDLKNADDRALLDNILVDADVFVSNLGPGAVERLGLGADDLRARRPELVHCTISGYGESGPYRAKKAYDLLIQCESGLLSVTGSPQEPAKAGMSIADISAGMYAYSGILAALVRRGRTGEGATIPVAMLDALGEWMAQPATFAAGSGLPPRRSGARHPSIAPYGPYPCGDGATVFLGVQNDREWARLCADVIGDPALATDPRFARNVDRVANSAALDPLLTAALATRTAADVVELLDRTGIANARMRDAGELLDHPQLRARDRWADVALPGGATARGLRPPVAFDDDPGAPLGPVPALGAHNAEIRAEFGAGQASASATSVEAPSVPVESSGGK